VRPFADDRPGANGGAGTTATVGDEPAGGTPETSPRSQASTVTRGSDPDVVVIGAGPAGLTLGACLARAGVHCLVLEREHHPRPHVGESLMPAAIPVMREIGFLEILEETDFPRSKGVVYHAPGGKRTVLGYGEFPMDGEQQAYTYHVDRAKFDLLLLKHAETLGCHIVEGARVQSVHFEGDAARGVRVVLGGGHATDIAARVVVDAGGRNTRIGRQLGLRRDHPVLDQFGLHAWLLDVDRGRRQTADYTHVYFIPELRGWAWQAPIDAEITSVGLVADKKRFQASGLSVDDFFLEGLRGNESLTKAVQKAAFLNELKGEVNYSYSLERVCGDGWVAVGDAARFLDPVFSPGVSAALVTARRAAARIEAALSSGDVSRASFVPYEDRLMTEAAMWDDFVRLFYRLLPSFMHLLEAPEHRKSMLRMIRGDVDARSDSSVLAEMRALVRSVEEADEHPWKGDLFDLGM
jgi:flavin-dependent dehydrogenase